MSREPGQRLGRYVLESRLATGGMGDAFLAKQEGPGGFSKRVVVKVMHPHYAREPAMVDLFNAEARLAAQLNHVSVVQVFDVGVDHGEPWIAMEFVDGLTLLTATRRCWALGYGIPIDIAVRVCAAAAQGLAHAHQHGIIHRDISPDNIIVARDGAVKLLDFGIAKPKGSEKTQDEVKGKIPYMAPEQLDPKVDLDGRCDLYSLGVTLYWCLAGRRPFVAEHEVQLIRAVLEDEPPMLSSLNPEVTPALEAVVMNLLEKKPAKREADGNRLATRLLATIPPTQENPVGNFIEGLKRHDHKLPEQFLVATGTNPGIPAQTIKRATLSLQKAPPPVELSDSQPLPASGGAPSPAPPSPSVEDVPSTTRKPRDLVPRRPLPTKALIAAGGALAVVGVVLAIAFGDDDEQRALGKPLLREEGPKRHLVVRDRHVDDDEREPGRKVVEEKVGDGGGERIGEQVEQEDDVAAKPGAPANRAPPRQATASNQPPAERTVSLIAPHDVRWTTLSGKSVGRGTQKVALTEDIKSLVAIDARRGGRTTIPVSARMDFYALPRGTLDVRVVGPAKRIKLGSDILGSPPLRPVSVIVGNYTVAVETTGKTLQRAVKIKENQTTVLTVDMNDAK